jgi:AraC-like DNA-binding protein
MIRSILTVFAPPERAGGPAPRIWNQQLCAYAGYLQRDGHILGDPKNAALTELALALGWQTPATPSRFDLLPGIISGRDGRPKLFSLPAGFVREVPLRHPTLPWFEQLGLRWYAVPAISDMIFHAAGTDFPAAPFNGWFMGTEIGARDLAERRADPALHRQVVVRAARAVDEDVAHGESGARRQRECARGDALARLAGLSPTHFSRVFKTSFGTSPIDWLRRERISQAKRRLADTADDIKEIAEQVGYSDRYFFSKDFKKHTGFTPSQFRARETDRLRSA